MPVRIFKCIKCEEVVRTLKKEVPSHCDHSMEEVLTAPETKFLEKTDKHKNKSQMKDQQKILKERARAHSRDNDLDELIQKNRRNLAHQNKWLNSNGERRKKIDDK